MSLGGTIYALSDPDTGNIRYCGKTIQPMAYRMTAHYSSIKREKGRYLYKWLAKVIDAGKKPNVMICEEIALEGLPRDRQLELLNFAEKNWIAQFKALGFHLTNGTNGGDGSHGRIVSEETKRKAAAANRGQKRTGQALENVRNRILPIGYHVRGEKHPFFGNIPWADPEGRKEKIRGEKNGWATLTDDQAKAIYADKDAASYREIATRHNTTVKIVSDIKTGKTWIGITGHDRVNHKRRPPGVKPRNKGL